MYKEVYNTSRMIEIINSINNKYLNRFYKESEDKYVIELEYMIYLFKVKNKNDRSDIWTKIVNAGEL